MNPVKSPVEKSYILSLQRTVGQSSTLDALSLAEVVFIRRWRAQLTRLVCSILLHGCQPLLDTSAAVHVNDFHRPRPLEQSC